MSDYGDEPGAELHRVDTKDLDLDKGSIVGYLAKYIAKNTDGHQVGDNEAMMDASDSSERVDAWASTYSLRQFQQIGGPPVGLWRELRRLRCRVEDSLIERAREAADQDDYAAFVEALGGIDAGRRCKLTLWREQTGELTVYGEVRGPVIAGIRTGNYQLRTRDKTWRIRWGTGAGSAAHRTTTDAGPVPWGAGPGAGSATHRTATDAGSVPWGTANSVCTKPHSLTDTGQYFSPLPCQERASTMPKWLPRSGRSRRKEYELLRAPDLFRKIPVLRRTLLMALCYFSFVRGRGSASLAYDGIASG